MLHDVAKKCSYASYNNCYPDLVHNFKDTENNFMRYYINLLWFDSYFMTVEMVTFKNFMLGF